jgi:hypothetical protein
MGKHVFRIFLIYVALVGLQELGTNIPLLVRQQPAFILWKSRDGLLLQLSSFLIFLLYPLASYIIFSKYFRRSRKKAFLYWGAAFTLIIAIRYGTEEVLFPALFHFRNYVESTTLLYYYVDNVFYACLFSGLGVVYFFMQNERQHQLKEAQLQLANQQTELSFLRSQINPHFLFNNLNNIYSLVYHKSEQSLDAIARLSDLLRYMLYDSHEKVPLQKELEYIHKYMELQQMRFGAQAPAHFEISGDAGKASIPPLLLIPFVENAFKHGDVKNGNTILIRLGTDTSMIRFSIINTISQHQKDGGGGIGLENVRRRLELLYPGRHSLQVQKTKDIFEVQLEIPK